MKMRVDEVLDILAAVYPKPKSELNYYDNFSLLISVILSAQATDISVNKATPALFERYPTPYKLAKADKEDVMKLLKTIGLYKNKSQFIIDTSKKLIKDFDGQVPSTREELVSLPGVGRKTANVVLAEGFGIPAIAVDTHVSRVSKRLGWAKEKDSVIQVEKNLMDKIPKERWAEAHHQLLLFGRYHSTARDKRDVYEILEKLRKEYLKDYNKNYYRDQIDSPIGKIELAATDRGLVYCASPRDNGSNINTWISKYLPDYQLVEGSNDILDEAKNQLKEYFSGRREVLDVPLELIGTDFRRQVWRALKNIPYGETRSYGEIARDIGNPKASRAVGQANNHNPISYFIP